MVRLRLKRFGRRHHPFYRLNAMDIRTRRDGREIEQLGYYDPCNKNEDQQFHVKEDRVRYWLSVGAQPSETVANLLKKAGIEPTPGAEAPAPAEQA
ncbi:30S ribosomal protein S16 [Mucisphaera calidilacus]|uniref:Small ribosomal subunit protein bS16 n=1 Tax=Mucisphaera calidilacus TaxID=2527982 RepID=A0A518BZM4_9BACT|nr:30S ribosomal protein S16 [Mucisphaera calidilacus]QDU72409.1 30S ribosomal protein S16 [Mucisphaera calidilacus]